MATGNMQSWLVGRKDGDVIQLTFLWTVPSADAAGKGSATHVKRILTSSGNVGIEAFEEKWQAFSLFPSIHARLPKQYKSSESQY
jgi:hypothetical protein